MLCMAGIHYTVSLLIFVFCFPQLVCNQPLKRKFQPQLFNGNVLWPNHGQGIPYSFASAGYSTYYELLIKQAFAEYSAHTCLSFIERTTQTSYLRFVQDEKACNAGVGHLSFGPTNVNLYPEQCDYGAILHEIGHGIGLLHTMSRPDRDRHIYLTGVTTETAKEFVKYDGAIKVNPYDYRSIMHYGKSVVGGTKIWAPHSIGYDKLSPLDLQEIDYMYGSCRIDEKPICLGDFPDILAVGPGQSVTVQFHVNAGNPNSNMIITFASKPGLTATTGNFQRIPTPGIVNMTYVAGALGLISVNVQFTAEANTELSAQCPLLRILTLPYKIETECWGHKASSPTTCGGHGQCTTNDVCICTPPFMGINCEFNTTDARLGTPQASGVHTGYSNLAVFFSAAESWDNETVESVEWDLEVEEEGLQEFELTAIHIPVHVKDTQPVFVSLKHLNGSFILVHPVTLDASTLAATSSSWALETDTYGPIPKRGKIEISIKNPSKWMENRRGERQFRFVGYLRCKNGYYGARCEHMCPTVTATDHGLSQCNGHGLCSDGYTGTGECLCEPGYDPAKACSECLPYYSGATCEISNTPTPTQTLTFMGSQTPIPTITPTPTLTPTLTTSMTETNTPAGAKDFWQTIAFYYNEAKMTVNEAVGFNIFEIGLASLGGILFILWIVCCACCHLRTKKKAKQEALKRAMLTRITVMKIKHKRAGRKAAAVTPEPQNTSPTVPTISDSPTTSAWATPSRARPTSGEPSPPPQPTRRRSHVMDAGMLSIGVDMEQDHGRNSVDQDLLEREEQLMQEALLKSIQDSPLYNDDPVPMRMPLFGTGLADVVSALKDKQEEEEEERERRDTAMWDENANRNRTDKIEAVSPTTISDRQQEVQDWVRRRSEDGGRRKSGNSACENPANDTFTSTHQPTEASMSFDLPNSPSHSNRHLDGVSTGLPKSCSLKSPKSPSSTKPAESEGIPFPFPFQSDPTSGTRWESEPSWNAHDGMTPVVPSPLGLPMSKYAPSAVRDSSKPTSPPAKPAAKPAATAFPSSGSPSMAHKSTPTAFPSMGGSMGGTAFPSMGESMGGSMGGTAFPSMIPKSQPTAFPSAAPTAFPSTAKPTAFPSFGAKPSAKPTAFPGMGMASQKPTAKPTAFPSFPAPK